MRLVDWLDSWSRIRLIYGLIDLLHGWMDGWLEDFPTHLYTNAFIHLVTNPHSCAYTHTSYQIKMDESGELSCVFCDRLKAICSLSEELVFCDLFRDANVRLDLFQFHFFSFVLSNLVETIVLSGVVVQWIEWSQCRVLLLFYLCWRNLTRPSFFLPNLAKSVESCFRQLNQI